MERNEFVITELKKILLERVNEVKESAIDGQKFVHTNFTILDILMKLNELEVKAADPDGEVKVVYDRVFEDAKESAE